MQGHRFKIKSNRLETRRDTFTKKYLKADMVQVRPNSAERYCDAASFEICELVYLGSFLLPSEVDIKKYISINFLVYIIL